MYNDKCIKTKISLIKYFYNIKRPKEYELYAYLFVIIIEFIVNVDKKILPQVFLRECKYTEKKKKIMSKKKTIKEELKLD